MSVLTGVFIALALYTSVILIEVFIYRKENSLRALLRSPKTRNMDLVGWAFALFSVNARFVDLATWNLISGFGKSVRAASPIFFGSNPIWVQGILALLFFDFCQYWAHRWKHQVPFFWPIHRFHHSTKDLNTFSTTRVHFLDSPIRSFLVVTPTVFLFGPGIYEFAAIIFVSPLVQILSHSPINTGYGWWGKVFVSPRFHRRHHWESDDRCNYGLVFSFWDHLFGTYRDEKTAFDMATGTNIENYEKEGYFFRLYFEVRMFFIELARWLSSLFSKKTIVFILFLFPFDSRSASFEIVFRSLLDQDIQSCEQQTLDGASCRRIFNRTFREEKLDDAKADQDDVFMGIALFGRVHDGSSICANLKNPICKRLRQAWSRTCSDSDQVCQDLVLHSKKSCSQIQDSFLKSDCLGSANKECQKDVFCVSALGFMKLRRSQKMKSLPAEVRKVITQDPKRKQIESLQIEFEKLHRQIRTKTKRTQDFPAPQTYSASLPSVKMQKHASDFRFIQAQVFPKVLASPFQGAVQPWRRGRGLTAVDWNGDGKIDILSVDTSRILLFVNQSPEPWKLYSFDLSSSLQGIGLIDVVAADLDGKGRPELLALDYPGFLHRISWSKKASVFKVETHDIKQAGRSFAMLRHPNGKLLSVISAWQNIDPLSKDAVQDTIVDLSSKKMPIFQRLSSRNETSMGLALQAREQSAELVISRDSVSGGEAKFIWDARGPFMQVSSVGPLAGHSSAFGSGPVRLQIASHIREENHQVVKKGPPRPKTQKECDDHAAAVDRRLCLMALAFHLSGDRPDLCESYYNEKWKRFCRSQVFVRRPGLLDIHGPVVFNSTITGLSAEKTLAWESALKKNDQIWHVESMCQEPQEPCFLMAERSLNAAVAGRLLYLSQNEKEISWQDKTPSENFDATNFILADFDRDGHSDLAYFSGENFYIYRGQGTGSQSSSPMKLSSGMVVYPQNGFMSRVFTEMPKANF